MARSADKSALVGNAADEEQVENAKREEKNQRTIELDDLDGLLNVPAFRRFLWRFWDYSGPFRSPKGIDDSATNYNAGLGDGARWVWKEVSLARPGALVQMMTEFGEHAD